MLNLIKNEWMKLWQKKNSWAMLIFLAIAVVAMLSLVKVAENAFSGEEVIASYDEQLVVIEQQLENPNLSESEQEDLLLHQQDILEMRATYEVDNVPTTREGIVLETFGTMSLVTLLTIIVGSGIVSSEFTQGTIKMLLSRPVKRWKILTSKYITVLLYSLLATAILFIVTYITATLLFPKAEGSTISFYATEISLSAVLGKSLYMLFLGWINTVVVVTLAFMIGTIFRSTSLAIGISIFLYFTGNAIVLFLIKYDFAKYILFANSNLTQYVTGYTMIEGLTMTFSSIVIIVYMLIFLALSYFTFIKRDVAA